MSRLGRNTAHTFALSIVNLGIGAGASIIMARFLGPEEYGRLAFLILLVYAGMEFHHLGVVNAGLHFSKKSERPAEGVYNNSLTFTLFAASILVASGLVLRLTESALTEYPVWLIGSAGAMLLALSYSKMMSSLLYGSERIIETNTSRTFGTAARALLIGGLFLLGVLSVELCFLAYLLGASANAGLLRWRFPYRYRPTLDRTLLVAQLKYGLIIFGSQVLIYFNYRIDQFMVKTMLSNEDLGLYSVSVQLSELLLLVPAAIIPALLGRLYNQTSDSQQRDVLSAAIRFTFLASIGAGLVGIAGVALIPWVYGYEYESSILLARMLIIGAMFVGVGKVATSHYLVTGAPKIHFYITVAVVSVNVLLNIVLIPQYGNVGAAAASIGSYFAYGAIYVAMLVRREGYRFRTLILPTAGDIQLVARIFSRRSTT